jgi:hypothetical protein
MGNLLTKTDIEILPNLYDTEESNDPICYIKLFTPTSSFTWYITEIDKSNNDICFGYIEGLNSELGYFSLKEIESVIGPFGVKVEKDSLFQPTPLSKIKGSIDG